MKTLLEYRIVKTRKKVKVTLENVGDYVYLLRVSKNKILTVDPLGRFYEVKLLPLKDK